jgi:Flp pilus assembly secretin CpaC
MFSRLALAGAIASVTALTAFGSAQAADAKAERVEDHANISVVLNHARVLRLSRPAATVIIGNPEIADATVRDSRTIILTGRGFGNTNMVVLDATGTPIIDERIAVSRNEAETLKVYRRAEIETLSCKPFCERAYLTEAEIQSIRATAEANAAGED